MTTKPSAIVTKQHVIDALDELAVVYAHRSNDSVGIDNTINGAICDMLRELRVEILKQRGDDWQPTMQLRWQRRYEELLVIHNGVTISKELPDALQQLWQSSDGQTDWRDVPVE